MLSTSVDSASPGRKLVDSLFSASLYLPGRFAATTTNFALRPAGTVRMRVTGELLQGRGPFLPGSEQRGELCRLGDRPQAGEALAHVGGRAAVDRLAAGEQRDAVFRAAGEDEMWPELAAYDALERPRVRADDRDLLDRREVEIERLQQVRERRRVLRRDLVQQPQGADRRVLVAVLAGERGQPQQAERRG